MPNPGEIILYKNYEFEDKSKANKLFVVLNSDPCLVLKTTSQSKRYSGVSRGCNEAKKVFFAPTYWQSCFAVDTYIQLPEIFELSTEELLDGSLGKKEINILKNPISDDCLPQLKNCLKKFKEDISEQHWKFIYSK